MHSNASRLAIAFALTFLFGGALGYLVGDHSEGVGGTKGPHKSDSRSPGSQRRDNDDTGSGLAHPGISADAPSVSDDPARHILAAVHVRDYFRRRHDIYEVAQHLNAESIRAAMEATQQFSDADRDTAQYALVARWLELDPTAAYEWIGALPKRGERSKLMREFFHSFGMKDPVSALSFLARYKANPTGADDFSYSVIEAWSAHDPVAAFDAALALADKKSQQSALGVALGRWAERDPARALSRIEQMPEDDTKLGRLRVVLRAWAKDDPEAAARHAASLPDERDRHEALASVVSATGAKDPDFALRLAEQIPAGSIRTQAFAELIRNIASEEPAIAARFVLALPPAEQRQSVFQVINGFARQDPVAALDFVAQLTSSEARSSAMRTVMQEWSSRDPKAAAQYCIGSTMGTPEAIQIAVASWGQKNAPEALEWARTLPAGAQREAALGGAVVAIARGDPLQAATLATTLLSGDKQANAVRGIAGTWARKDPAAAAGWASQLGDQSARMNAVSAVAFQWAREDPAGAAAWASQSPNNAHILPTITREWAAKDSISAAKWLDTLPSGNTRDGAISAFTRVAADTDPASAAAWAATISQPSQRDNAISDIYRQWKRADPTAADTWLRTVPGLTEQVRERMIRSN